MIKLKDNSKKDCFAHNGKECEVLNNLYCKYQKCNFCKTKEDLEIDEQIAEERLLRRISRR